MKVRLRHLIQDQLTMQAKGADRSTVGFIWDDARHGDEVFLDGPVSTRVAVVDFDPETGGLRPAIPLDRSGLEWDYDVVDNAGNPRFQALSTFAIVHRALAMFESEDILGRRLEWAFEGSQLLVVPRAGNWRNAYYERESHSLQFFSFVSDARDGRVIHTSASLDVVSHEVGHAILDAVAPHLYDCVTPQSLAIHEAVADLTALFIAIDIGPLRRTLLSQTGGGINRRNAYNQVAEEFGAYTNGDGAALRSLLNDETLETARHHNPFDFHFMSQVLSGAIYRFLVDIHDWRRRRLSDDPDRPDFSRSGEALAFAATAVRRMVFRGLDYLPPGEISFFDFGRAVLLADAVANPDDTYFRRLFARAMAPRLGLAAGDLAPDPDRPVEAGDGRGSGRGESSGRPAAIDVEALLASDWYAYHLVDGHREFFEVPDEVSFRVEPRLDLTKMTWRGEGGRTTFREVVLKISWEVREPGPPARWVRFGTTVGFDHDGRVVALLTTNPAVTGVDQAKERRAFVGHLLDQDLISFRGQGSGARAIRDPDGLRIRGTGRQLHLADGFEPPRQILVDRRDRDPEPGDDR